MTNPIPPCPVCGVVPCNIDKLTIILCGCWTDFEYDAGDRVYIWSWLEMANDKLVRALSDKYGIHTLAELESRLAPDPRVAVLAAEHRGMKVSAAGILLRPVDKGRKYMLAEMHKHLEMMATRYYAGEISVVDEFLQLYDLADDRAKLIAAQRGEG